MDYLAPDRWFRSRQDPCRLVSLCSFINESIELTTVCEYHDLFLSSSFTARKRERDSRQWGKTVICTSSWIRLVRSHFYSTKRSRRGHLANSVIRLRLKLVQSIGSNECDCITSARGNLAFFSYWSLSAFAVQSKTTKKERRENQTDPFITSHRRISHLIHSHLNFALFTRSNNETNSSDKKMSSSGSPHPGSVSTEKRSFC